MLTVFVVTKWERDGDNTNPVLGVFDTRQKAENFMKEYVDLRHNHGYKKTKDGNYAIPSHDWDGTNDMEDSFEYDCIICIDENVVK